MKLTQEIKLDKDLVDKIKEKYNLTFTNEVSEKIMIKPLSKWTWTSYPVDVNDCINLSLSDFVGILLHIYQFNGTLDGVEPYNKEEYLEANKEASMKYTTH